MEKLLLQKINDEQQIMNKVDMQWTALGAEILALMAKKRKTMKYFDKTVIIWNKRTHGQSPDQAEKGRR